MEAAPCLRRAPDRRDQAARDDLVRRVRAEFHALPGLTLTSAQLQRLFALDAAVCDRILAALVREGALTRGSNGQYRVNDAASVPPPPGGV